MAITLTYGYQRISTIGTTYGEIRTYAKVNSQDKNLNKSYFNLKLTYFLRQWIEVSSANANVDGSTRGYGYTRFNGGETTILEVGREIQHNEDGSSPVKNVFSSWSASFGGGGSTSADIVMPKIDRLATVIRANDFNDEENPTMEFSNPVGFKVHPYLYFYKRGDYSKEVFGLTRKIDNAPTPYNWVITEEEREQIRNALNEATEYDVAIGLFTYNFENVYLGQTNIVRKFTIVDCEPLIELTCTEKNEKVKAITNNEYILVNNVSILNVEADLTLKKGANASKVLIQDVEVPSPYSTDLNITGQEETYVVNGKIIDSRQLANSKNSPPYQLIDYRPVKIDNFDFKRENPTSSQIILNAEITYWQVTVNNVANVPIVSYSADGELFNEIPSENYSIDEENHKLRITNYNVPTQLDYREQGTYYLKIEDKFTIDNENQVITKGIPTFEAGENDFQVNGTLYVADDNRENKINIKKVLQNCVTKSPITPTTDSNSWVIYDLGFCRIYYKHIYYTYTYSGNGWGYIGFSGTYAKLPVNIQSFDDSKMIFLGTATCEDGAITQSVLLRNGDTTFAVTWQNKYDSNVNNAPTDAHLLLIDFNQSE